MVPLNPKNVMSQDHQDICNYWLGVLEFNLNKNRKNC